jgi:hypothetical protein
MKGYGAISAVVIFTFRGGGRTEADLHFFSTDGFCVCVHDLFTLRK